MNEANDFYEDMRSRHQAVLSWRDNSNNGSATGGPGPRSTSEASADADEGTGGQSGNGLVSEEGRTGQTRDGTKSTSDPRTNLSPNG